MKKKLIYLTPESVISQFLGYKISHGYGLEDPWKGLPKK